VILLATVVFALLGPLGAAHAQLHRATDPVATPASALIGRDDASAIDVNPGALGLLPTWSLVYVHSQVDQRDSWLGQGDALSFATPLFFGFSLGATVQSIRPGVLAARPGLVQSDRALAGLGLAFAPSKRWSIGTSGRVFASSDPRIDGLFTVDTGLVWHASDWLGFSFVGRDLFVSRRGFGTAGLGLGSSALVGTQLRPLGNPDLVLDFNLGLDGSDRTAGRAGLGLRVPYFGYASGVVEVQRLGDTDSIMTVMAELDASLEGLTVGGGAILGDGLDQRAGYYVSARAEGQMRHGLPVRARVLDLELDSMNERSIVRAELLLEAALHDERIAGVLLRPRSSGMGSAYAQELRLLISSLRKAGKHVVCHLEDATGSEYYACAGADQVLIDPAGSLRLLGGSADMLLLGETLHKVGLRADFVRIGAYKSAPEQLTQSTMSEPAREEVRALLDDVHNRTLSDLAKDLSVPAGRVADIMDDGPQLASQALRDGLVRAAIDEERVKQGELAIFGDHPIVDSVASYVPSDWNAGPRVGVVMIDGAIVDGDNVDIPFIDVHMSGGKTVVQAIDAMLCDPLVRAIVVRVDSPGGAVLASDQIWRAIRRAREHKPVVVSMGAVAASGGYYVASAADEIWADPSTLTGSIGIFYGKVDAVQLAEKLGIGIEVFQRGKRAGAESLWRPFSPDERAALVDRLRAYYRLFLERVAAGRGKTPEQVDQVARGRVYSGDAALRLGLVDHLGGLASALARARQLGHISDDAEFVVLPKRKESLLDYVVGDAGGGSAATTFAAAVPPELRSVLARIVTMQRLGDGAALALLPYDLSF
jgi:protease-4